MALLLLFSLPIFANHADPTLRPIMKTSWYPLIIRGKNQSHPVKNQRRLEALTSLHRVIVRAKGKLSTSYYLKYPLSDKVPFAKIVGDSGKIVEESSTKTSHWIKLEISSSAGEKLIAVYNNKRKGSRYFEECTIIPASGESIAIRGPDLVIYERVPSADEAMWGSGNNYIKTSLVRLQKGEDGCEIQMHKSPDLKCIVAYKKNQMQQLLNLLDNGTTPSADDARSSSPKELVKSAITKLFETLPKDTSANRVFAHKKK